MIMNVPYAVDHTTIQKTTSDRKSSSNWTKCAVTYSRERVRRHANHSANNIRALEPRIEYVQSPPYPHADACFPTIVTSVARCPLEPPMHACRAQLGQTRHHTRHEGTRMMTPMRCSLAIPRRVSLPHDTGTKRIFPILKNSIECAY